MEKIQDCTKALIAAMKGSREYLTYLACEEKMSEDPQLKKQVDEYRIRNYKFMSSDGIDHFEEVDRLQNEYKELRKKPVVNEYLEAELEICKMVQQVENLIHEQVTIQIPEL